MMMHKSKVSTKYYLIQYRFLYGTNVLGEVLLVTGELPN